MLRDVLATVGAGPSPTVPEAFQAIGRARERFSSDFREVFDRARAALATRKDGPELDALWSAVLEAAGLAPSPRDTTRVRYQLLLQEDELDRPDPILVATARPSAARGAATFLRLDDPFGEFGYLVSAADGDTTLIATLLLLGALNDRAPNLTGSPVVRAVTEGVLLFRRNDYSDWELVTSRPPEGQVRALVRMDLCASLLGLFERAGQRARPTRFDGWSDIGPFDINSVRDPTIADAPGLASVRCLQSIEVGPHLHLVGGIRIDGGFLGTRGLLPSVHLPDAEHLTALRLQSDPGQPQTALVARLVRDLDNPSAFLWTEEQEDLEGSFVLAGTRDTSVIASRQVLFHSRVLSHNYAVPSDPQRWLVEVNTPDLASASDGIDGCFGPVLPPALHNSRRGHSSDELFESPGLNGRLVDEDQRFDRFVEAMAAISARRKGLTEYEVLDLLQRLTGLGAGYRIWDVVRGWNESGFFDVLTRRNWRGRVYFARRPRLVVIEDGSLTSVRVTLQGLAPFRLRGEVQAAFAKAGAAVLKPMGYSPHVPVPPVWRVDSVAQVETAARSLGLGEVAYVRDPRGVTSAVETAISDYQGVPGGYELEGVWDWQRGGFRRPQPDAPRSAVQIDWYARATGPDRFVVVDEQGGVRTTLSRTWALLLGFKLARKTAFESVGSHELLRPTDSGPYLPLPVARALVLRTGVASGPFEDAARGLVYGYQVEGRDQQLWLLNWLCGVGGDATTFRRFAWLVAASQAPGTDLDIVAIPIELRRRLRELTHIPDAAVIADRRISRRLLPHVRRAIDLVQA
jgi:hypothetical protein